MAWLDTAIVSVIVLLGAGVMYKALKEPMDAVGRGIKKGAIAVVGMFKGAADNTSDVITYG